MQWYESLGVYLFVRRGDTMEGRTRRDRQYVWLIAAVAVLAAAAVILGTAQTGQAGGFYGGQSCYPHNEYVYNPGSADVSALGWVRFAESELEYPQTPEADYGGGKFFFAAEGKVRQDGGWQGLSGTMSALIFWDVGGLSIFKSGCMAEVQSTFEENSLTTGGLEMEGEGAIFGFPGRSGAQPAVMSLGVAPSETAGKVAVHASFELGTTCFEGDTPSDETEVGFAADSSLVKLSAPNRDAGRWGFPSGYGPSNCPGAG